MEEPGGLQSMGLHKVGHDRTTSLPLFTFMHWKRKRQPTPVFLPGESQGWQSLVGCHLWGRTKSDTSEVTQQQQQHSTQNMSWSSVLNRLMKNTFLWQLKISATCLLFQLSITSVSIHLIIHNHSLSSLYADAATKALDFYIF